ncbi:MAG: hypothetical protein R3345_04085 [Fulvivirga sp.]|nr:hypothetical protein [Fulvivirga sp.]
MKIIYFITALAIFMAGCQQNATESTTEASDNEAAKVDSLFKVNSETIKAYIKSWENENIDHDQLYAEGAIMRGTGINDKDSISLEEMKAMDKEMAKMYDFEFMSDVVLLPGVNAQTLKPDGSVRYYGDWKVIRPATDTSEERSAIIKLYESFDFDEGGKIVYQQVYGDFTGLMHQLHGEKPMEEGANGGDE